MSRSFAAALALIALPAAAQAQAQEAAPRMCITPAENEAVIGNLLPAILRQAATRCATLIDDQNYLPREGAALADTLRENAGRSWPVTKTVFERIGGTPLPDDQAVIDTGRKVIAGSVAAGLDAQACDTVSRLVRELAPLPADNFTRVFALALELGISDDSAVPFKVCRADAATEETGATPAPDPAPADTDTDTDTDADSEVAETTFDDALADDM
ncbi:MAG: hypothetical protein AAF205_12825 [Pseudomonadota bacterium]